MTQVLGFDTATAEVSVAATRDGELVRESFVPPGDDGRPRHSAALLGEIAATAERAGGWEAVDRIGVGVGPGSFTGLRIGVATARALAQALELPLVPVESLAVLAAGVGERRESSGQPRLPLIDARRGELFAALHDGSGERLWGPEVLAPAGVCERIAKLDRKPLAVGDGSLRFRDELMAAGAEVPDDRDGVHRVAARVLCRMAEGAAPSPPGAVEPLYLRPPDAEAWLERDPR
jgi:tRNA threonylcarbamoyladenosine biosynthesis protein TsaB